MSPRNVIFLYVCFHLSNIHRLSRLQAAWTSRMRRGLAVKPIWMPEKVYRVMPMTARLITWKVITFLPFLLTLTAIYSYPQPLKCNFYRCLLLYAAITCSYNELAQSPWPEVQGHVQLAAALQSKFDSTSQPKYDYSTDFKTDVSTSTLAFITRNVIPRWQRTDFRPEMPELV